MVKAWQPSHVELVDMHGTRGIMQAELELIVGRALQKMDWYEHVLVCSHPA